MKALSSADPSGTREWIAFTREEGGRSGRKTRAYHLWGAAAGQDGQPGTCPGGCTGRCGREGL